MSFPLFMYNPIRPMNAPDPMNVLNITRGGPHTGLDNTAAIPPLKNIAGAFTLPNTNSSGNSIRLIYNPNLAKWKAYLFKNLP